MLYEDCKLRDLLVWVEKNVTKLHNFVVVTSLHCLANFVFQKMKNS